MQTHILSFGIGLDFQSRHIKQSHRKVFMAFDFSHFFSFLFSMCVRAVRVCRSINRMNLSPRKGVRVSLLRVHVLMLLLYSQIERLMCVCVYSVVRAYLFKVNINIYFFRQTLMKSNRYLCLYADALALCVFNCSASQLSVVEVLCAWFRSAKQKSRSRLQRQWQCVGIFRGEFGW